MIERNFRCRSGEIDLVLGHGGVIVFVEVKTRSNLSFGSPKYAVDQRKQDRIIRASMEFLLKKGMESAAEARYDVVSIEVSGDKFDVEHIEDAFQADGY